MNWKIKSMIINNKSKIYKINLMEKTTKFKIITISLTKKNKI